MKVSNLRDVIKPGSEIVISYDNGKGRDDVKVRVNLLHYETWLSELDVQLIYVSQFDGLLHIITESVAKENI